MAIKVQVIFYSMYGHVYKLAEAVAAGARQPSESKMAIARFQGRHVAEITTRLAR